MQSKNKTIVCIIIAIVVVVIACIGGYFAYVHEQKQKAIANFNATINEVNEMHGSAKKYLKDTNLGDIDLSKLSIYASEFSNFSNEFKTEENNKYATSDLKAREANNADYAKFLSYDMEILKSCSKIVATINSYGNATPGPDQIQSLQTEINNLLSSKVLSEATEIYNSNAYVRNEMGPNYSIDKMKSFLNEASQKLGNLSNDENLVNSFSESFNGTTPFTDVSTDNGNNSGSNANTSNNGSNTNNTASNSAATQTQQNSGTQAQNPDGTSALGQVAETTTPITGHIGNSQVTITVNNGSYNSTNQTVQATEKYSGDSNPFNLAITSEGQNSVKIVESYKGKETGVYNVKLNNSMLVGTFTNKSNNKTSNVGLGVIGTAN